MGVVELGTALTLRPLAALQTLEFRTTEPMQFIDITDDVAQLVRDFGEWAGVATIFSRHTTAAIRIQEDEPLLLEDLHNLLLTVAPPQAAYRHNDFAIRTAHMHPDERPNGHSHCAHLILGASEHVPVRAGELMLGTWQRIFLVELDGPRSSREVLIQMTGMATGAGW
jgi:secondary thiamine-phosphate synthase enzyme